MRAENVMKIITTGMELNKTLAELLGPTFILVQSEIRANPT